MMDLSLATSSWISDPGPSAVSGLPLSGRLPPSPASTTVLQFQNNTKSADAEPKSSGSTQGHFVDGWYYGPSHWMNLFHEVCGLCPSITIVIQDHQLILPLASPRTSRKFEYVVRRIN